MSKTNIKRELKTLMIGLKEIQKLQPFVLPVTVLDAFFKSIAPFINIFMSARIIDELLRTKSIERLIFLVGVTIILNLIIHLISTGLEHAKLHLRNIMIQNQDMVLNEKIISMDYENIENPEVHSMRTKITEANTMKGGGVYALIDHINDFIKGIVTVIISIVLVGELFKLTTTESGTLSFINSRLFSYGFLILILIGTLLILNLRTISEKKYFLLLNKFLGLNRIFGFYMGQAMDYNVGKGIRLYNQKELFNKEVDLFIGDAKDIFTSMGNSNAKYSGIGALISSLIGGMVYIFIGLKAIAGAITIGSIVQYVGSINQFISGSSGILTSFNSIINNNMYLQLYIDFMNIKGAKYEGTLSVDKDVDKKYEIEFKDVSFKYPGTEKYVIENVSLKINMGERLAIVGMNGSGKTTFIKLLCRLYDPNEGEILLNGVDIKEYSYDEYMSLFSVVFQDFKLFSFPLGQNVASSVNYDDDSVVNALEDAGLGIRLSNLPKGLQTPLYKDFDEDGVEISGGEAQKIAIARSLYRDAPILILDEPTAALDPIAEFEIYSKFNEIVGTKTALYISHRLSSCRFCDEIVVFHEGQVIQKGKHKELLQSNDGKYHELWHSQAQYYTEEAI